MIRQAGSTPIGRRLGRVRAVVAIAKAIEQAAARLFDGLEASGFDLQGVPEEVLGSLSARELRPAFGRATAYLRTQCNIDVHAILSTV
jgi:hypothetical protein